MTGADNRPWSGFGGGGGGGFLGTTEIWLKMIPMTHTSFYAICHGGSIFLRKKTFLLALCSLVSEPSPVLKLPFSTGSVIRAPFPAPPPPPPPSRANFFRSPLHSLAHDPVLFACLATCCLSENAVAPNERPLSAVVLHYDPEIGRTHHWSSAGSQIEGPHQPLIAGSNPTLGIVALCGYHSRRHAGPRTRARNNPPTTATTTTNAVKLLDFFLGATLVYCRTR